VKRERKFISKNGQCFSGRPIGSTNATRQANARTSSATGSASQYATPPFAVRLNSKSRRLNSFGVLKPKSSIQIIDLFGTSVVDDRSSTAAFLSRYNPCQLGRTHFRGDIYIASTR
jgi:hypothetical protein